MMMNPVLRRETKTTLRSWKMFAILTVYVAVVALGAILFLYGTMFNSYNYSFDPAEMTYMYVVLCAMQMGLMLLAAPAMTAGCISGERERQTLDFNDKNVIAVYCNRKIDVFYCNTCVNYGGNITCFCYSVLFWRCYNYFFTNYDALYYGHNLYDLFYIHIFFLHI